MSASQQVDPDLWLTNFPTKEEIEKFAESTQRNATLARTCLQEAKSTQARLTAASVEAQEFCQQCNDRNFARSRKINQMQENLRSLRPR